ncbi:DUF5719 family protein [Nocardioides nanhaiensis]|uniref:Uncharacterized protein n=1 Tax=Nocardioides nanhaiensis TaxID=1476871 RepID=A0ABP8VZJ4_9ACTN
MSRTGGATGSRATRSRRGFDLTVLLAVLLPLAFVGLLLLVQPDPEPPTSARPPSTDTLTRGTLVCPGAGSSSLLTTAGEGSGELQLRVGEQERAVPVEPGGVTAVETREPVVALGVDDLAPGLAGTTQGDASATACTPPRSEVWFTGVGAGARHSSVLELVNPDAGPATVDVLVHGREGLVEVPALRGLAVPGGGRSRVELATAVPRGDDLTLHVTTTRGRVAAHLLDTVDQLGAGAVSSEWLPAQSAPSTDNLLLGLPGGADGQGQRVLVLTNPGDDETRAALQLVTAEAAFTPEGVEEIVVPPGATVRVALNPLLRGIDLGDALGLRLTSGAPLTADLRSFIDGDLAHVVPADPVGSPTVTALPEGAQQLLLAAAEASTARVEPLDAQGDPLRSREVELAAGATAAVELPEGAVLVRVTPQGGSLVGSVLVGSPRLAVVPLLEPERESLVADVVPLAR